MKRSSRTHRIVHCRRDVSTCRPMHLTVHLRDGLPSLRTPSVRRRFLALVASAKDRGVKTVVFCLMANHIHWVVIAESRAALADATRYVFGQLARWMNRLCGRSKGKVYVERFHSTVGRVVRQAFQMIGYVLRNPRAAGLRVGPDGWDRYTETNRDVLATHPFLVSVFGPYGDGVRDLLRRMVAGRVAWTPRAERLQPRLPGL